MDMLRVIIADDEAKVCQLICHLVDWHAFNMEIIDVVNDGNSAMESVRKNIPDIVVTDIRMPGYDGIELIKKIKELYPDIYFIIISGYSQFEYAKQAIKYGVENYLLKPLKKKELEATLNNILKKYHYAHQISSEKVELMERLHESQEKNKKNIIKAMLEKKEIDSMDIEQINREYNCSFGDGVFVGIAVHPFLQQGAERQVHDLILNKICQILEGRLVPVCNEAVAAEYEGEVICAVNLNDEMLIEIKKQLHKLWIEIINWKEILEGVDAVIGIGRVKYSIAEIADSLAEAREAILSRMVLKNKSIIEYEECQGRPDVDGVYTIDKELRNRMLYSYERLDAKGLLNGINELEEECLRLGKTGNEVYSYYKELIQLLLFGNKNYMPETGFPEQNYFMDKYRDSASLHEVYGWLKSYIEESFETYFEKRKNSNTMPIRQVKQYMAENYNTNISLEDVSGQVGFNPAYFSSLFKKETGKNFTEYLMEIRIQNAKEMLVRTNMDIADIAEQVGYSDLKYFSKVFKRITGVNPSDYRKLYG